MKCSCQAQCPDNAKFCHSCGHEFQPKANRRGGAFEVSEDLLRLSKASMLPASEAAYDALRAIKRNRALRGFGVGLAGALGFFALTGFELAPAWLSLVSFGAGCVWAYFAFRFGEDDYYSLPHSRDVAGGHRCIWCGGRGIWRKGQYKSDVTHAHCSSCKTLLFTE